MCSTWIHTDDSFNSQFYVVPTQTKHTILLTLEKFMHNYTDTTNTARFDPFEWPFNIGCSGMV